MSEHDAQENTDRVLWAENESDYYTKNTIFVTKTGGIGIQVGGLVFVKPLEAWHQLAMIAAEEDAPLMKGPLIPDGSITPIVEGNAFLSMLAKPKGEG